MAETADVPGDPPNGEGAPPTERPALLFKLSAIKLDASIQTRETIDPVTVSSYVGRMVDGDTFPPVVLYGTESRAWIGDGWHRVLAAKQLGAATISADLRPGGRDDALKYALGANHAHGRARTNADKAKCVRMALDVFPNLSSRAVAKLCGVSHPFVEDIRQVATVTTSEPRTGADGKTYPATRGPTVRDNSPQATTADKCEPTPKRRDRPIQSYVDRAWRVSLPLRAPLCSLAERVDRLDRSCPGKYFGLGELWQIEAQIRTIREALGVNPVEVRK